MKKRLIMGGLVFFLLPCSITTGCVDANQKRPSTQVIESQNTEAAVQTIQETTVMDETEPSDFLTKEQREQLEAYGYWIYEDSYALTDSYRFPCIQVDGMADKEIQNKVNDSLKRYFELLRAPDVTRSVAYKPVIHLQSSQYLSVENFIDYISMGKSILRWKVCVTVDIQTGEVVFLDDLLSLDEVFAEYIQTAGILKEDAYKSISAEETTKQINQRYSKRDLEYIMEKFATFSRGNLYKEDDFYSLFREYFYLEEGKIVYYLNVDTANVTMMLEDLKDFLKVPEW